VSEVRSYEGSVGRKRPRSRHHSGETQTWAARVFGEQLRREEGPVDPPKRFERRENARASGQAASSPNSVGRPRGETRGSERRKHTRWRVHASSVRVAEVDRTHRASCPPGGCKASWRSRQGASQKEARSHHLTWGTSGEKANRCAEPSKQLNVRMVVAYGFRLVGSRDDGRHSWAIARLGLNRQVEVWL